MSRTAFVTGADGFVGLNLTKELLDHGWKVIALTLPSKRCPHLINLNPTIIKGDITDPASLELVFPEDVDAVFHVAADTSLSSSRNNYQTKVNVDGTRNVVRLALKKNARRFIHMSTVAVFGFHQERIHENTLSTVHDTGINYFISKAQAEAEVFKGVEQGLNAVVFNPANILGPYDINGWAQIFIKIRENQFSGIGNGGGSFCHVSEVVRIMREAVDKAKTGERYILGGVDASFHDVAVTAQRVIGGTVPQKPVSSLMMTFLSWVVLFFSTLKGKEPFLTPEIVKLTTNWLRVESTKATNELGYTQHSLERMVRDSCHWLSSQNVLPE